MSTVPAFADAETIQISYGTNENAISTGGGTISYSDGWNNATNNSNSSDAASTLLRNSSGEYTTATTTWTSKNTYMWNDAETGASDDVLKGYLDDGTGVTITVSNISYLFYDVTVIASTDTNSVKYTAKTINGNTYTSDGSGNGILGSDTWGDTSTKTVVAGDNSFTVSGLYRDLSLSSTGGYTGARGCIAGLIITNATSADAAVDATISANSEWMSDSLARETWKNDASSETQRYANLTLSESATLNVTGTGITTHAIIATADADGGEKTLTLSGKDVNLIGPGVVRTDSSTANIVINNKLNFANGGKISGNVSTSDSGLLHVSGGELDVAASSAASLNVSIDSGAMYALTGVGTTAVSAKVSGAGTVAVVGVASDFTGGGDKSYITLNNVSDTSAFTGTVELRNVQAVVSGSGASSFAKASKVVLNSAALHFNNYAATFSKDIEIGSGQNGYIRSFGDNKIASGLGATIAGNVSGAGTLTSSDDGDVTFTGTVDIGAYVANKSGGISVFSGDSTKIGTLTMNNGTTVNFIGTGTNTITTANVSGGTLSGGNIKTANLTGGTLSGGNITTANVTSGTVAISGSTISTLSQTDGTLDFSGTGTTTVGSFTGPTASGGGTNPVTTVAEGATVDVTNNFVLRYEGKGTSTLNVAGTLSVGGALTLSRDGNGIANINEGGTLIAGTLGFGQNWSGSKSSVVNVNTGATLIANGFTKAFSNINSSSFNLSGGTLGTSADFVTLNVDSLPVVLVAETTSTINTSKYDATTKRFSDIGSTISIANVISGTGALNVSGAGTLTLSGTNTFTGGVTISAGTLVASNASALGTGNVTVASGAMLSTVSGTQLAVGTTDSTASLTTESGSFLGMAAATTDAVAIAVTGTVSLDAGTIFDLSSLTAGESLNIKLISGSGVSATGLGLANLSVNGVLVNQRGSASFSVSDDNVLSLDSYTAGGAATLTWKSDSSGAWENAGTRTWTLGTSTDRFYNGDSVIFDADASVEISGTVLPATMKVNAGTTLSLSGGVVTPTALSGTGTISLGSDVTLNLVGTAIGGMSNVVSGTGTVVLTGDSTERSISTANVLTGDISVEKTGTGKVSIYAAQSYTGGTTVSAGNLGVGNSEALGTGTITLNGGQITAQDGGLNFDNAVVIGSGNGTIHTQAQTMTFSGEISGTGTLTKDGGGILNLSGSSVQLGRLTVSAGTVNFTGTGEKTISGKLVNSGTTKVGSGTTLNISGSGTSENWNTFEISDNGSANVTTNFNAANWSWGCGVRTLTIGENATLNVGGTMYNAAGLTLTNNGLITAGTIDYSSGNGWSTNTVSGNGYIVAGTFNVGNQTQFVFQNNTYVLGALTFDGNGTPRFGNATIGAKNDWSISKNVELTGTAGTEATTTVFNTGKFDTTSKAFSTTEGYTITLNGVLSGAGGLTKAGAGTLTLSGANTFSGGVTISAGKLIANNNSALGAAAGSVKIAGGQLEISSDVTLVQTNITIALSDAYSEKAAILGDGALTDGTKITLTKAEEIMIASLVEQTKEYQIFASDTSLASKFKLESFTLDEEVWEGWKISKYDNGKVTLELIPEPSAFGLLAGVGALVFVAARRRRRAK